MWREGAETGRTRASEREREREKTHSEIISNNAYEIPGSNLVIHT